MQFKGKDTPTKSTPVVSGLYFRTHFKKVTDSSQKVPSLSLQVITLFNLFKHLLPPQTQIISQSQLNKGTGSSGIKTDPETVCKARKCNETVLGNNKLSSNKDKTHGWGTVVQTIDE